MRAANLRSSSVRYVTMPITTLRTTKPAMAALTAGGIRRPSRTSSPVDLPEHRVHRAHDRDDVGHLVPRNDVGQHGQVRERCASPLHPVRLRAAVGDQVAPDLTARALDPRIRLALRDPHLAHRLHTGARGDGPRRQAIESLAHDLDRLAELDHPHPVARVAIAFGLD